MENYLEYILPVLAFALLTAGWMAMQLIAKKIGTKNHIDNREGCCGACDKGDTCSEKAGAKESFTAISCKDDIIENVNNTN